MEIFTDQALHGSAAQPSARLHPHGDHAHGDHAHGDHAHGDHAHDDHAHGDHASAVAEPDLDLADQVFRLVRTWSYLKAKMVSTVDPEVGTLFLISRLIKDGPTRAKDLAEATCADQSTVSRQVAALVKAGLVERQADPDDGRASILVPTPLGVARVHQHFANRGRALEPLVADWSDEERQQFVHLLRRFTSSLEDQRDDVARVMTQNHAQATAGVPGARAGSQPAAHHHAAQHEPPEHHGHAEQPSHPAFAHPHASTERSN